MNIKACLGKLLPYHWKRFIQNIVSRHRCGVSIARGAHAHQTQFGKYCSIGINSKIFSSSMGRSSYIANDCSICFAKIGRFCAIGDNVRICLGNHPTKEIVSIHPAFYSCNGMGTPPYCKEEIFPGHKYVDQESRYVAEIGNDVWIGNDVRILDGITIGDGAIVGIGSIVTKDIEPYSIVAGVPAKEIGKRFDQEKVDFLLSYEWWKKDEDWLRENSSLFHSVDDFVMKLSLK